MSNEEILKEINEIFVEVLENSEIIISELTTAEDIEEWDSLSHIMLVTEIEKKFNKRFTSFEILSWKRVSDMIQSIKN
jgi:acyl carrier protein